MQFASSTPPFVARPAFQNFSTLPQKLHDFQKKKKKKIYGTKICVLISFTTFI